MKQQFKANPGIFSTNYVLEVDDSCFISFNPSPGGGFSIFESDDGGAETALVLREPEGNKFYILNGDFREKYQQAIEESGKQGAIEVYLKHEEEAGSTWTTNGDTAKFLTGLINRIRREN